MSKKIFTLLVLLLSCVNFGCAVADDMVSDWIEDMAYFLTIEDTDKISFWLQKNYSGYICETDEQNNLVCEKYFPHETIFSCGAVVKENEGTVISECTTEEKKIKTEIKEAYEELTDVITSFSEDYVSSEGLSVNEEEWEKITDCLYTLNKKNSEFSYWLIGKNVIYTNIGTVDGKDFLSLNIINVNTMLDGLRNIEACVE